MCSYVQFSKGADHVAGYGEYENDSVTRQFIINENTPFIVSETYGKIRANLVTALKAAGNKSFVITSQCRSEGKTTTAINLSIMLSRLEKRVLLIDGDLRRSGVDSMLRLKNRLGLSNILLGECDIYDGINPEVRKDFHVITSGPLPSNPADLIGNGNFDKLLGLLRDYYDYIVIDTPPLCIANDALIYSGRTAGTALVVRENKTTHNDIRNALSAISLSGTPLLGVIKTHCYIKYDKSSDYKSAILENAADPDEDFESDDI